MEKRLHLNQDLLAGLMFFAFGAFFVYFGRNYDFGTALRMGPGYLPVILGAILVAMGLALTAKGAVLGGEKVERWAIKPLILVSAAFLVFAWSIASLGLLVTAIACMIVAALGGGEFKFREQTLLAAAATAVSAVAFIHYLGLPMRYLPRFLGLGY